MGLVNLGLRVARRVGAHERRIVGGIGVASAADSAGVAVRSGP